MSCMRASWVTLLAALALAGCASSGNGSAGNQTAGASPAVANDGRCHADGAQFAVGKPASAALLEQARTASGSQIARILQPHDVVTLEYRSDRVNLNADDSGKIMRVNCG
ncbi:I78 family peptidase inhibitor [Pseudomonas putida]